MKHLPLADSKTSQRLAALFWGSLLCSPLFTLAALLFAGNFNACTDAGLQPISDAVTDYVDDKLALQGSFCTSPADEVTFPVKILIVIDQSASLQCTDPGNNRLTALNQAGSELDALPNVEFGVVGFASWSRLTDFTSDWRQARDALAPESGQGGPATDYQGALSTTLRILEQDMVRIGAAERARTKYMVLFISDGVPEPRCRAGCDDGDTTPDSLYGVCNTSQSIPENVYVDMNSVCPDYNQTEQIVQKVQDIVALGDFYGVGAMKMHTIFLFAPEEEVAQVCGDVTQFGYVREEAEPLLRAMANEGLGTFRDVNISSEIDFLDFDYESLQAPYELSEFFAVNTNMVPAEGLALVDSDGDGIPDEEEFSMGLDRLDVDSDNDRFSDYFEYYFEAKGFAALEQDVPAIGCRETRDRDADGLRGCEEEFLHTDPLLPDTDGDRIPDGLELRFGTDPLVSDMLMDHDFDGRLSGSEIRRGTHPQRVDKDDYFSRQVLYGVKLEEQKQDQIRCYSYSIEGLTLAPTLSHPSQPRLKGRNRIYLYALEAPKGMGGSRGRFHVACIEARYMNERFKDPPSGRIQNIDASRFVEMQIFDPDQHCLVVGDDPAAVLTP